jgi:hypothetical protein
VVRAVSAGFESVTLRVFSMVALPRRIAMSKTTCLREA